ncbi:MAG: DUF59 domain-containing protein [Deltaproteobacteria bacterium]|nr:DUF59 domain-containing protein [Deltaproteobacteria bacterium]
MENTALSEKSNEELLREKVIEVIKTCHDPEIPVNIYELGLIYEINFPQSNQVEIKMTLTSPSCPAAGSIPPEVESKIRDLPEVNDVKVEVVWDPPWTPEKMSEAAKLILNVM